MLTRMFVVSLVLLKLLLGYGVTAQDNAIRLVRILPETVYAEQKQGRTRLNFDFEIENTGKEDSNITYIELRAFDHSGQIVSRQHFGGNGLPGPISMLPSDVIPAGGTLYLFNPFPDIPVKSPVASVKLRVFHTQGSFEKDIPISVPTSVKLATTPIAARTFIFSGSDLLSHHRRVSLNSDAARALNMDRVSQRFAIDLTALDTDSGSIGIPPYDDMNNWPGFGLKVIAPVSGTIVDMRENMPDNRIDASGQRVFAEDYESFGNTASMGNFLLLRMDNKHHLFMSHFQQNTITVKVGDTVYAGQELGLVGMSGDTAYPHLHFHMQDGPDSLQSNPLPMTFGCLSVGPVGAYENLTNVSPNTGQFIAACE